MRIGTSPIVLLLAALVLGCSELREKHKLSSAEANKILNELNDNLTEATIAGTLSPPAAARCFAYANIAAFEAIVLDEDARSSIVKKLDSTVIGSMELDTLRYIQPISLVYAYCTLAKEGVYHPQIIEQYQQNVIDSLSKRYRPEDVNYTLDISRKLSENLVAWMRADGFSEMRKLPRYELLREEWSWEPTPPKYTEALDPWWYQLRPFVLDSASIFRPELKVEFSKEKGSVFYQYAKEVFDRANGASKEEIEIANFWDCNPYLTKREGHALRAIRQMSPGAHWIGLTRQFCTTEGLTLLESSWRTATVAVALHDAFISVWDAKYHYSLIRPETYINRYIDPKWRPIVETPHFPEYTSGHSAISAAASQVLTQFFGENYAFTDSLEVPFGKPPRQFKSIKDAANEAAMSRLLGGIHYRFANEDAIKQGDQVGNAVIELIIYGECLP